MSAKTSSKATEATKVESKKTAAAASSGGADKAGGDKAAAPVAKGGTKVAPKAETKTEAKKGSTKGADSNGKKASAPAKKGAHAKGAAKKEATPRAEGDKKPRHQWGKILQIDISQARCKTHLSKNIANPDIGTELKELKGLLKAEKKKKEGPERDKKIEELRGKIKEMSKEQLRLSSDASIAVATVADWMIKELIDYGLNQVTTADKKKLDVVHLHESSVRELATFPLFKNLPSFRDFDPEAESKHEAAATEVDADGEAVDAEAGEDADAGEDGEAVPQESSKTTFNTYVENAIKTVKRQDERFKNMRVSSRIRAYGSDLIVEFLKHISRLAQEFVLRYFGARTLSAEHIRGIIELLLMNENRSEKDINKILESLDEKVKRHKEHLDAEAKRKETEMPDEKKKKIEEEKKEKRDKKLESGVEKAREALAKMEQELQGLHHPKDDGAALAKAKDETAKTAAVATALKSADGKKA